MTACSFVIHIREFDTDEYGYFELCTSYALKLHNTCIRFVACYDKKNLEEKTKILVRVDK